MHKLLVISLLVFYLGVCASDTFKCPQPSGYFSHPTDPHKFYECSNGEPWEFSCPGLLVFSTTLGACNYDTSNQTTNSTDSSICKQPNGLYSHPTNAHKFYECTNGVAQEFNCPESLIFDPNINACNYDSHQTLTNVSSICKQPNGYFSHPTDSHKFYECTNGVANEFICPANLIFDATLNVCKFDPNQTQANSTVSPVCTQLNGYFRHPTETHKFYECTNGVAKEFSCPENLIFDTSINACKYDPNQISTNTTDSSICKQPNGLFSHPTEPHKFYECSNGVAKEFSCAANLIFDATLNACKYDPNQSTQANTSVSSICTQLNGFYSHPTDAHKFYECTNGIAIEFMCPENLIFDITLKTCKYDPNANTSSTSTDSPICTTKNGYFVHPTEPHRFYECTNGVAWEFTCPGSLIFDINLKSCAFDKNANTSSTTDSPICTQKNGLFSHPTEPHKFYECSNGVATEFSCPSNLIFDTSINACKYDPSAQTTNGTTNSSICVQSNGYYSHPTDAHKFYECTNGVAKEFVCPDNLIFDLALRACNFDKNSNATSTSTDSPICAQKNGYYSHPTDAHKFYECSNGVANELVCGENLVFNPTVVACTFDPKTQTTNSSNSTICTKSDGIFKHPTDAHKFYECTNGIPKEFSCPENLIFDITVSACNYDTNNHTAVVNTTQSSICVNNGYFSHPTDRHKFYICNNGVANEFVCADSLVYNATLQTCSFDTSHTYFVF